MLLKYFFIPTLFRGKPTSSIHDFSINSLEGKKIDLRSFAGKKILLVNTASECGLTPQFKKLEELYRKYQKELVVIGFPSNDFANQEPLKNSEIKSFCERNYGVTFLMTEKISVKGPAIHPIYKWLTSKKENGVMNSGVKWNFQKYLINEKGELVDRVLPWRAPDSGRIIKWIRKK